MEINGSKFRSTLKVRPDDIDMNGHVHSSRYIDYVLAARYEQMDKDYRMPMEEFIRNGWGWVISSCTVDFKRPLFLGETFIVTTQIIELSDHSTAKVAFEIHKEKGNKLSCSGQFHYTMVNIATGRAQKIPDMVIERYSV